MGLIDRLGRWSLRAVHVLPVEVPGGWRVRVGVEQSVTRRGWRLASSPADADLLVVCGAGGPAWAEILAGVWEQLPGPRARGAIDGTAQVEEVLDRLAAVLGDPAHQQRDAVDRRERTAAGDHDMSGHGMDMGGHDMDTDMGDHDTDGHDMDGDMDMSDMDMDMDMDGHGMHMDMAPSGIPLATGADDRDGLEMDELHVTLGPVLPCWPAGLVVHCSLHGDLVSDAQVEWLPGTGEPAGPTDASMIAAGWCDSAASLLRLAGAVAVADRLVRTRNDLLDPGVPRHRVAAELRRLTREVRSSKVLRWSLAGLGAVEDAEAGADRPSADVFDRLGNQLAQAAAALHGDRPAAVDVSVVLGALPRQVTGLELAAARLVIAGVWPPAVAISEVVHV